MGRKRFLLIVVLLLVLLSTGCVPPVATVPHGWLRERIWPTTVEPVADKFDILQVSRGWQLRTLQALPGAVFRNIVTVVKTRLRRG